MENGSISTPAFNRGFVWKKELIKSLFESIDKGYPIGTIIAVKGDSIQFTPSLSETSNFPDPESKGYSNESTIWIIDGTQRLSALYNILRSGRLDIDLFYKVDSGEFSFESNEENSRYLIKMSDIFNSKSFMDAQVRFSKFNDDEKSVLIEKLNAVHKRFQYYQVPVQVISDVNNEEIIEIFQRLNMSGIALSKAEFDNASKSK
jgi:uncharacterized protein with ParB-like and HNH nuclease domain